MCRFTLTFNRNYRCTALHRTVSEILALVYELAPIDRSAVSAVRWETRSTILIYTDKPTGNVLSNHDSFSPLITGSRVQKNVLLDVLSYRGWGLRTSTGQRSFAFHVPSIWNSLPSTLWDISLSLGVFKNSEYSSVQGAAKDVSLRSWTITNTIRRCWDVCDRGAVYKCSDLLTYFIC